MYKRSISNSHITVVAGLVWFYSNTRAKPVNGVSLAPVAGVFGIMITTQQKDLPITGRPVGLTQRIRTRIKKDLLLIKEVGSHTTKYNSL